MDPPLALIRSRKKQQQQPLSPPSPLAPQLCLFLSGKSMSQDPFPGTPAQEAALTLPWCAGDLALSRTPQQGTWSWVEYLAWLLDGGCLWFSNCYPPTLDDCSCPGYIWVKGMNEFHSW